MTENGIILALRLEFFKSTIANPMWFAESLFWKSTSDLDQLVEGMLLFLNKKILLLLIFDYFMIIMIMVVIIMIMVVIILLF